MISFNFFYENQIIAKRLLESKQTVPHYYLAIDINVSAKMALPSFELNLI